MKAQTLEVKESDLIDAQTWWQKKGLSYTPTGCGKKIPTQWKIKVGNRTHRIYIDLRAYRENDNTGAFRVIQRRELIK